MTGRLLLTAAFLSCLTLFMAAIGIDYIRSALAATAKESEHQAGGPKREGQQKSSAEELQGIERKRQELMEKEAALAAKEQEINRFSATLDAKIKELAAAQKAFEESVNNKKKLDAEYASERYRKMIKLLKGMKPEESAKLIDKLDEDTAIAALNQLDQKTVIKMSRFINQPRLVRWLNENLQVSSGR